MLHDKDIANIQELKIFFKVPRADSHFIIVLSYKSLMQRISTDYTNVIHKRAAKQPLCVHSCNSWVFKVLSDTEKLIKAMKIKV